MLKRKIFCNGHAREIIEIKKRGSGGSMNTEPDRNDLSIFLALEKKIPYFTLRHNRNFLLQINSEILI